MTQRIGLWWIFGVMGAIGGWLTAAGYDIDLGPLISGTTAIVASLLGGVCERFVRDDKLGAVACCIMAAGVLNGAVIGLLIGAGGAGLLVGGLFGLFHALPFLLPMLLIAVAARDVGNAREGSIVDTAQRRRVIRVAAAAGAVSVSVVALLLDVRLDLVTIVMGTATCAAALVIVVLDVLAARRLRAQQQAWISAEPREEPVETAAPTIDFGTGDGWRVRTALAASAYRNTDTPTELFHGDADLASTMLASARGFLGPSLAAASYVVAALTLLL